jgi:hypothetical protein
VGSLRSSFRARRRTFLTNERFSRTYSYEQTFLLLVFLRQDRLINLESVLEESARANPDARIRPLTHVSVNRAYQAESVGGNSLVTILNAIRRSPNL